MTFQQKLDLIQAVTLVADFWEVEPTDLIGFTASFVKPEKKDKWNEIAKEVQEFAKMNIYDRAEKLGFTISPSKD